MTRLWRQDDASDEAGSPVSPIDDATVQNPLRRQFLRLSVRFALGAPLALIVGCPDGDDDDDSTAESILGDIDDATWAHSSPLLVFDCRFSDPINLRFTGGPLADIVKHLKNAATTLYGDWDTPAWEPATHFVLPGASCEHSHVEDLAAGSRWDRRYHLRLWDFGTQGFAAAVHVDDYVLITHQSLEFESAEELIAKTFEAISGVTVDRGSIDLKNETELPANDGRATLVKL